MSFSLSPAKYLFCAIALLVAVSASASDFTTKLVLNIDSNFPIAEWHSVTWTLDFDDFAAFNLARPTDIVIPQGATRGRCGYQVALSIPLPHSGSFLVKATRNGSAEPELPFITSSVQDPTGLLIVSGWGAVFMISEDRRFKSGDVLRVEVFVPKGNGTNPDVTAFSWFSCEWSDSIFSDGLENGLSRWAQNKRY